MSETVNYVCDWIIERDGVGDIERLFDNASKLDCIFSFKRQKATEGFFILTFYIQAPSEMVFQQYREYTPHSIKLEHWLPMPQQDFPAEAPHPRSLDSNIYMAWLDGLREKAIDNEILRRRLNTDSQPPETNR